MAFVLALLLGATAPVRVSAAVPTPEPARPELAREAYAQRDFLRAARMYEALFIETHAVKYVFNAGMAREAAGHDAQALLHWVEYLRLAGAIDADERNQLLRQMAAARRRTAPVRLLVASPQPTLIELRYAADNDSDPIRITVQTRKDVDLDPGLWTVSFVGSSAPAERFTAAVTANAMPQDIYLHPGDLSRPSPRPVIMRFGPPNAVKRGIQVSFAGPRPLPEQQVLGAAFTWHLTPEAWVARVQSRGYLPTEVALGPTLPPEVDVTLRRDKVRALNNGLGLGFAVAGAGLLAAGVTLAARGSREYRNLRGQLSPDKPLSKPEADTLLWSIRAQTTGLGLLSGGLATGVVAVTAAAGNPRWALITEATAGATLTLVGAIGLPLIKASYGRVDAANTLADADSRRLRDYALGSAMGAGIGLLGSSLIALVTRAVVRRSSATPRLRPTLNVAPQSAGVLLRGHF